MGQLRTRRAAISTSHAKRAKFTTHETTKRGKNVPELDPVAWQKREKEVPSGKTELRHVVGCVLDGAGWLDGKVRSRRAKNGGRPNEEGMGSFPKKGGMYVCGTK